MTEPIDTWFNSWNRMASVAIGAVYFYLMIVVVVRVSGKRLTSQLNNFDWIVTIAIGSLVGAGILLKDVSIADSSVAIVILVGLQWMTTNLVRRSELFCRLIKPSPTLLTHKGEFLESNMRKERISEAEVVAKLREHGFTSLEDANWVVLETDGNLTVIPKQDIVLRDCQLMGNVKVTEYLEEE